MCLNIKHSLHKNYNEENCPEKKERNSEHKHKFTNQNNVIYTVKPFITIV